MNEVMNETVLYYPTPLEQAYSLYVVQQVFLLAPTMPLRIPGRLAVPFLTQSGVNRMTLRSIWTAADPQNIGTLTLLTQFQLLLRLISMAQFGILEAEGSAESMREAVQQHAAMRLALPRFSSVVIPAPENLMAMYGMFVIQYASSSIEPEFLSFGGVTSVPSFGASSTVSVDDAFGDLGPVENAPLPTLGEVSSVPQPSATDIVPTGLGQENFLSADSSAVPNTISYADNNDEDEFGDFEAVSAVPESTTESSADFVQSSGPSSDVFGDQAFGLQPSNQETFANAQQHHTSIPEPVWQQHDVSSFGYTPQLMSIDGSAPPTTSDETLPKSLLSVGTAYLPGHDVLGGISMAPAPASDPSDTFGQAMLPSVTDNESNQWVSATAPQSITDAFGALVMDDPPLPSLSKSGSGDGSPDSDDDKNTGDEDHFGDFETAAIPTEQNEHFGLHDPASGLKGDPFSIIEHAPTMPLDSLQGNSMVPTLESIEDTFGEFASLPDPSIQPQGPISTAMNFPLSQGDLGDDAFGGFEEAAVSQAAIAPLDHTTFEHGLDQPLPQMEAFSQGQENANSCNAWPNNEMVADVSMIPPTSSFNYSANPSDAVPQVDDDPFAAFDAIAPTPQLDLPPLTATLSSDSGYNQADLAVPDERNKDDADDDDFGEFATPKEVGIDLHQPTAGAMSEKRNEDEDDDDDFGDFTTSQNVTISSQPPTETKEGDHSFGDFVSTSDIPSMFGNQVEEQLFSPTAEMIHPLAPAVDLFGALSDAPSQGKSDSTYPLEDFGSFEAPVSAPSLMPSADDFLTDFDVTPSPPVTDTAATDEFGALGSGAPISTHHDEGGDVWGDFNLAPTSHTDVTHDFLAEQPQQSLDADDDWGDFDAAPVQADLGNMQSPVDTGSQQATLPENDSDWGTFTAFPDTTNQVPGDMGSAEMPTSDPFKNETAKVEGGDDAFEDDWGDFEDVGAASATLPSTNPMQQRIRGLAMPLIETILRKSDVNGGYIDLGECFEVHIGLSSPLDPTRTKRVERCIQILEILSKMDHNHGYMYWDQVMKVVRDELVSGFKLINEAKSLSPSELDRVARPLETMILGLREFVRVARSIIATLGDLLMLDPKALLTVDTMSSTWCSLRILEVGMEIESEWKLIVRESKSLLPSLDDVEAPAIAEIRSVVLENVQNGNLCELTLQPLLSKNKSTTKAEVQWNGKHFMACSGNLLANRCPFYVA